MTEGSHGILCTNHDDLPIYHETRDDVRFCWLYGPVVEWSPTTTGVITPIAHAVPPFNWHDADRDSFTHWALVAMITDGQNHDLAQQVLDASNGARNARITIEINGIRFPGLPFFERLWNEMMRQVDAHAADMVESRLADMRDLTEDLEDVLKRATQDLRTKCREAGLPMKNEWED